MKNKETDAIVRQCQACYLMYSEEQIKINKKYDKKYNLPVIFYPQILGLALRAEPVKDLGLNFHSVETDRISAKVK